MSGTHKRAAIYVRVGLHPIELMVVAFAADASRANVSS